MRDADFERISEKVLALIRNREARYTPGELTSALAGSEGKSRRAAKSWISRMVAEGILAYADQHGRTVIDLSFERPVRITRRMVLLPSNIPFEPKPDDIPVRLSHGVSFGTGQHPTTRLCLKGLETVMKGIRKRGAEEPGRVLDIGTGSGVLAVAALQLGMDSGIGLDIDPCAISEAKENARLNGLENRLEILNVSPDALEPPFTLIIANLRAPTLHEMHPQILRLLEENGGLVLSGIRTEEASAVLSRYAGKDFPCVWRDEEKGWAALAFA